MLKRHICPFALQGHRTGPRLLCIHAVSAANASGTFDISEAHTIAELKELKEAGELQSVVVPVDEAARHLPELRLFNLSEKQRTLISNGASVECGQAEPGTVYRLYLENEFMGLALRDDSGLHITVWFGKEK